MLKKIVFEIILYSCRALCVDKATSFLRNHGYQSIIRLCNDYETQLGSGRN